MNEYNPQPIIENKLEILKELLEVKSKVARQLSSDFLLAKLNEKEKTYIIETVAMAYYGKKQLGFLRINAFEWKYENNVWYKVNLSNDDSEYLRTLENSIFQVFLTRVYVLALLNRNVEANHLVRIIAGLDEDVDKPKEDESKSILTLLQRKRNKELEENR